MKLVRGVLKVLALFGGALVSIVSLMALVGAHTANGWARAGLAIVVALVVPLFVVERILARLSPDKMKGVTSDVLAITYVGFSLAFVGAAHAYSRPVLQDEGARLAQAGMPRMAKLTYLLAGGRGSTAPVAVAVVPPKPPDRPAEVPAAPAKPPELRAGDGKERTPAQIFTEFAPSVVTITVKGPMGEGGGTGFIVDSAGTIGTNYHVIDGATEIKVKLMDGTMADAVEVLVEDQAHDLALLHVTIGKPLAPVALGDSDKVTVGERAVSIGNPLGLEHTLTDGLISSRRMIEGRKMIQMSAPVSPGNSGGPLFNARGEVIGVTTAIYLGGGGGFGRSMGQNLNLAMPINDLRALLRSDYPGRHKAGEASKGGRW